MNLIAAIEWAEGYNRRGLYSPIGVAFHWTMAVLMVWQIGHGAWLAFQPVGASKFIGYQTHAHTGMLLMVLGTLRFFWKSQIAGPKNVDEGSWAGRASRAIQAWFYLSFFALPLSGWVMWSTSPNGLPLSIAGLVPLPLLPFDALPADLQQRMMRAAALAHFWIVVLTAAAIPGHAGAAVWHHLVRRDRVLQSMLDLNGQDRPGLVGSAPDAKPGDAPRRR